MRKISFFFSYFFRTALLHNPEGTGRAQDFRFRRAYQHHRTAGEHFFH